MGSPSACAFDVPRHYLLEAEVRLQEGAKFTVAMREQEGGEGYRLALDATPDGRDAHPTRDDGGRDARFTRDCRATLSGPGFSWDRKWPCDPAQPVKLQVFVQGTLIECFINDAVAMTCRAYDYQVGKLGFEVSGGEARIGSLRVRTAPPAPR